MKTFMAKKDETKRDWLLIDAAGKTLGRVATEVACFLRGKHKPVYTPHIDTGDYVVIVNAEQILVTGQKASQKIYYRHSGYPGGIKGVVFSKMIKAKPEYVIRQAVKGMLPKNALGRQMMSKLKVYAGGEHPHEAQQPRMIAL